MSMISRKSGNLVIMITIDGIHVAQDHCESRQFTGSHANLFITSKHTAERIAQTQIEVLSSDTALVQEADYILSIVPPRDAFATAKRITTALTTSSTALETPRYYLDLNAISPQTAREIGELFSKEAPDSIRFVDGGIIGGAPSIKPDAEGKGQDLKDWKRPSIPLSGPDALKDAPPSGTHLSEVLNSRHLTSEIGSASGLKMAFASTTKGYGAICIQAFTTAHNLGVLDELKDEMKTLNPKAFELADRLVTSMPPKAYRWVGEMEEIGKTFDRDGGFAGEGNIFRGVKETYRIGELLADIL